MKSKDKPIDFKENKEIEVRHETVFSIVYMSLLDWFASFFDFVRLFFTTISLRELFLSFCAKMTPDFAPDTNLFQDENSDDFFGEQRGGQKFIGKYTKQEMTDAIAHSKLGSKLKAFLPDWYVEFDLSDSFSHYGYIRSKSLQDKDKYYGFIIVQVGPFQLENPNAKGTGSEYIKKKLPKNPELLNIRWFSLQNPLKSFDNKRPRLPGQRFPGTGLGRDALEVLVKLCRNSKRDGIVNNPEHFHNAFMYENFMFLNPSDQGTFEKMKHDLSNDLKEMGLSAVSWAIYLGFLQDKGKVVHWDLKEQVLPLSFRMAIYFHKFGYRKEVKKAYNEAGPYTIDWERARQSAMSAILKYSPSESSINH